MAKNKNNSAKNSSGSSNKNNSGTSSTNNTGGSMKDTTQMPDKRPARSGPGGE